MKKRGINKLKLAIFLSLFIILQIQITLALEDKYLDSKIGKELENSTEVEIIITVQDSGERSLNKQSQLGILSDLKEDEFILDYASSNVNYSSYLENVEIGYTLAGFNPSVTSTLDDPADLSTDSDGDITFECSATATDSVLTNITLYHNLTGSFEANQTNTVSGTSNITTFTLNGIVDGISILWNCLASNNETNSSFAANNRTVTVSIGAPPLQ